MGRKPGFQMSDEQKAAMAEGRRKARIAKEATLPEPYIPQQPIHGEEDPRYSKPKRILTPEHLAKIQAGRIAARERKIANGEPLRVVRVKKSKRGMPEVNKDGKPIIYVTKKMIDAFDYYEPIRDAFRMLKRNTEVDKIIRKITDRMFWQNTTWIQNTLNQYVELREAS